MDLEQNEEDDVGLSDALAPEEFARFRFVQSLFPHEIPTDWKLVNAGLATASSEYGLSEPEDRAGDTRIVGMKHLQDGKVIFDDLGIIKSNGDNLDAYRLRAGDILLNRTNSPDLVGKVAIVESDSDAVFASYLVRLRVADGVDPHFLNYWLNSSIAQRAIKRISTRAISQANVNPTEFRRYCPVPLPPIEEQRRIATILRTQDNLIEASERLVASKLKRLSWFRSNLLAGLMRLDGTWSDWATVRLADVLVEHGQRSTGDEPVYSVSVHKGLINQIEHLGRSFAAASTAHYNRVMPGDVVYTKSPTGDFPLGIIKQSKAEEPVIVSPLYGVFTPRTQELGFILDAYFQAPETTRNYLAPLVQKGAKNTIAITNQRFLEGKLYLPPDPVEQRAIAGVLHDALSEIDRLKDYAAALRRQKRGLMQKLLTGEWRTNSLVSEEAAHV